MASDDYGKDLTNVQNLQKKHALLEADVAAHQVVLCGNGDLERGRAVLCGNGGLGRGRAVLCGRNMHVELSKGILLGEDEL